jgi:hypothetical protein
MKPDPTPALEELQAMPGALPVPEIKRFYPKTEERKAANDAGGFIRVPEQDVRLSRGDICNGNAWREVSTGSIRMFNMGYDPNARTWLALDDVEGRARIDGDKQ